MVEIMKLVGEKFRLPGELYSYSTITMGNVNSTYKVTYEMDGRLKSYLFQQVNTHAFKKPVEIMKNIDHVTTFIRQKYPQQITLHFHHTADGANYYITDENSFWRVVNYVESITINSCDDLSVIEATGKAFGNFQTQLSDFDGSVLYETIPGFHNTKQRLDTLFEHIEEDPCGRVKEVTEELEYLSQVRERAADLSVRFARGEIPKRVTHNDTKANNVLFHKETKEPLVVVDLDTIMPGMSMYDFGDAVRFIANAVGEDEPDLSKVYFDTEKFKAFAKGFIRETKNSLTEIELQNLVTASFSITIELASRFLDDYLVGNRYFRCEYPKHNLVRARCQLKLAQDIDKKSPALEQIVRDVIEQV
ncbi:MAG: aminoglycoside phosphotransferase family protein [Oscillospiraceae bacterium]|nr:aminoglycoside phosphotransferase family protein [Oscillospiraceae bacterium]